MLIMFFVLRLFLTQYCENSLFMMKILPLTTGEKIRIARQRLEIKQSTLADDIGVDQNTLSRYETDKAVVSSKVLPALCKRLGISADYLLNITFLKTNIESSD